MQVVINSVLNGLQYFFFIRIRFCKNGWSLLTIYSFMFCSSLNLMWNNSPSRSFTGPMFSNHTHFRHNSMTIFLIFCWFPLSFIQNSTVMCYCVFRHLFLNPTSTCWATDQHSWLSPILTNSELKRRLAKTIWSEWNLLYCLNTYTFPLLMNVLCEYNVHLLPTIYHLQTPTISHNGGKKTSKSTQKRSYESKYTLWPITEVKPSF